MAKSYYSTVLDHAAERVWEVIRPFDRYAWAGVPGETTIEDVKAGDQVGAVRAFAGAAGIIRQRLLAHSDADRSYTYEFCGPPPLPVCNYVATIRVIPVTESGTAFVEWSATFDCAADEHGLWTQFFENEGFAKWLGALRGYLAGDGG